MRGFGGVYEVSDQGRVRSLDRTVVNVKGIRSRVAGRIMAIGPQTGGYMQAQLRFENRLEARLVSRMVLEAFVGPAPEGHEACHGNGVQTDNRLDNLRWDTRQANRADAVRHGTAMETRTHCPAGHPYDAVNTRIIPSGARTCRICARLRVTDYNARDAAGLIARQSLCAVCHKEMPWPVSGGRPRLTCSPQCRWARRKNLTKEAKK